MLPNTEGVHERDKANGGVAWVEPQHHVCIVIFISAYHTAVSMTSSSIRLSMSHFCSNLTALHSAGRPEMIVLSLVAPPLWTRHHQFRHRLTTMSGNLSCLIGGEHLKHGLHYDIGKATEAILVCVVRSKISKRLQACFRLRKEHDSFRLTPII